MDELKAAVDEYDVLSREIFPDLRLGLLHGRLKPDEKDATMRKFRTGEYDVPGIPAMLTVPCVTNLSTRTIDRIVFSSRCDPAKSRVKLPVFVRYGGECDLSRTLGGTTEAQELLHRRF